MHVCVPEVSANTGWYDDFPVEMSLAAFVIVRGRYQKSAYALQMLLVMVWLQLCLFGASQMPQPAIRLSCTSYLTHGGSGLHPSIPVASVRQA